MGVNYQRLTATKRLRHRSSDRAQEDRNHCEGWFEERIQTGPQDVVGHVGYSVGDCTIFYSSSIVGGFLQLGVLFYGNVPEHQIEVTDQKFEGKEGRVERRQLSTVMNSRLTIMNRL